MRRVVWPLREMGADMDITTTGTPPVIINKQQTLTGTAHKIKIASAQVKSALLLAGLRAHGETSVLEPSMSRDHTERMLEYFGVKVRRDGLLTAVAGGGELRGGLQLQVPADMSSAAFFMAAAAMTPGSDILLTDVGINPGRLLSLAKSCDRWVRMCQILNRRIIVWRRCRLPIITHCLAASCRRRWKSGRHAVTGGG